MKKYLSLISLVLGLFLISCDDAEINLGEENLIENQSNFQVDFDGQTYIADYTEASIINGVTIIKAYKTSTKEYVVINLNNSEIGNYTLSPNDNIGKVSYKKDENDTFFTSDTAYSGRIDISNIDMTKLKLFGNFSFIGIRMIPSLDAGGNQLYDDVTGEPLYNEEIKNFTNGLFSNIDFSIVEAVDPNLEPDPEPTSDTFFMKIDTVEFIETTLTAEKVLVDGVSVINIRATNTNHVFEMQMPADVVFSSQHELFESTTDAASEAIVSYKILSGPYSYGPYSGDIVNPRLTILTHDAITNKIVGTFEFSAHRLGGGTETLEFTEGAFSLTYTE